MSLVLVTGGSGFIGGHCILQLLAQGHQVRTTVRNLAREPEVRALLKRAGAEGDDRLTFAAADLERDAGWPEAAAGCDFVLHVASPFPQTVPKNEDELIVPAREGALRVLKAARAAGVKRVVLTSSFAAIGYGHKPQTAPFDETSWTDVSGDGVAPYAKSKTLAERAAWDFVDKEGGPELSVVNPVGVFGPVLGPDTSTSILVVQRLMDGALPGLPQMSFGVVDVRDVADLHLRAMTDPRAKGRAVFGHGGRLHDLPRDRIDLEVASGRGGAARADPCAAELALAGGLARRSDSSANHPGAGQDEKRNQRQGAPAARLGAAVARGRAGRDGRKPHAARALERKESGLTRVIRIGPARPVLCETLLEDASAMA
jgi:nucleoside-diphosphate-sugar epimerase